MDQETPDGYTIVLVPRDAIELKVAGLTKAVTDGTRKASSLKIVSASPTTFLNSMHFIADQKLDFSEFLEHEKSQQFSSEA